MNAFLRLPRAARWAIALPAAALCVGAMVLCFVLPLLDWRWLPLPLALPFVLAPLESLLMTPLYTVIGRFRYYSPMLLATPGAEGAVDLHVGTLFDYLLRLRWRDRGPRAAALVTADLLRGLLALADEVERGRIPAGTPVTGTSYFFSDRTAARFGFELRPPAPGVALNLVVASLSIALRLSFTRGRPTLPRLGTIRQAVTTAGRLRERRAVIARALARLERSLPAA